MPEAMASAFNEEFEQPEKLRRTEDELFLRLLRRMGKRGTGVKYTQQWALEVSDEVKMHLGGNAK